MTTDINQDTIVKEIIINAPAERVFAALAEPAQRIQWWGVAGKFETTSMESDLRPGGAWIMRGISMGKHPFRLSGEYRAVDRPRLLEFTMKHESPQGAIDTVVRFDLSERDSATLVRLTHSGLSNEQARQTYQGWPWLLSLLKQHVEKQA